MTAAPPPSLPSRYWAELRTTDFDRLAQNGTLSRTLAVLPVAATEQHGPHLPLGVDTNLLEGVLSAALQLLPAGLPVLVLPTQAVGFSPEHTGFAGTLSFSAETLIRIWTEIGEAVARTGVRQLLLLNGHGGQVGLLDVVGRDLRSRLGLTVWSSSWFSLPQPPEVAALFPPQEHRYGIHAGDSETSMMLALHPEQVDMAQARHFASASEARAGQYRLLGDGRSAKLSWAMEDYNPAGAVGNAAAATADKGRALIDAAASQLALLMGEICSAAQAGPPAQPGR
ncbi:creatininase family protein [Xylophilus rhododendri]|uniref:Creatininase family protein n=1 Tax=Xylophilus rhododendri TaxID=2697032 RepID=A0A857J699_9BURK|nr:creatininase family protein [Xylophilus rhododendri]QHI98355.1 creatininase family protein [Xylophilus rhododendri]